MFLWKIKKGITITNAFQKVLNESDCKPNKIWGDKGTRFYNRSMESWLQDNIIKMHLINFEEKSVVTKIFIRTFKDKISKYMTSISKNV